MDKLMHELGFGKGYIAQGGDVGSRVARVMSVEHEACKAVHRTYAQSLPHTLDSYMPGIIITQLT